jgi:hypothetical protein
MKKLFFVCIALGLALPGWAGQGWYFIRPPIEKKVTIKDGEYPWRLVLDALFSTWWDQTAFDTAKECESYKLFHVERAKKGATDTKSPNIDFIIRGWEQSLCIASDDPRLAR